MNKAKTFRFLLNPRTKVLHRYPTQARCRMAATFPPWGMMSAKLLVRRNPTQTRGARLCAYCFP